MAVNVSAQYNIGFLSDMILLTQCYYHRVTRFLGMLRRSRCVQIFLKTVYRHCTRWKCKNVSYEFNKEKS